MRSVYLEVRQAIWFHMEQFGSHLTDFHEIYLCIFVTRWRKFKFHCNLTRITVTLLEDQCTFMIISRCTILKMRNDSRCREKRNKQFYSMYFFTRESCSLGDNFEKCVRTRQDADENIISRMRFACWVTEFTGTHSRVCKVCCFSITKMVPRTRFNATLYILCLSCFSWFDCHAQQVADHRPTTNYTMPAS